MTLERILIGVLLISQVATGSLLFQQNDDLKSVLDRLSFMRDVQLNHNHGTRSTDALAKRIDELSLRSRNSDFGILQSFDDTDASIEKLEERVRFLELALDPIDYRVSMIDCGETRVNVTINRDLDDNICRWKR